MQYCINFVHSSDMLPTDNERLFSLSTSNVTNDAQILMKSPFKRKLDEKDYR